MEVEEKHSGDDVAFALFDGDYHIGLGALVNSLFRAGFRGLVYAGYRGSLPPWAGVPGADGDFHHYAVGDGCAICFVKVEFAGHLTNYKPAFMLSMLGAHEKDARRIYYFDVDIVVKAPWRFFQDWVSCGIGVCRNGVDPYMSENHPLRKYWRDMAAGLGLRCRPVLGYFNGGFIGLSTKHLDFLTTWDALIQQLQRSGRSLGHLTHGMPPDPATFQDQDMMNVALMASDLPISPVENTGMDFSYGGYIMSHAVGRAKPWRRRYLLDALLGYPPDQAHRLFWRYANEPIAVMPQYRRVLAQVSLRIAALIGRFYGRR
jgi:hypothetical protein